MARSVFALSVVVALAGCGDGRTPPPEAGPQQPPNFDEVWIPGGTFTMGHDAVPSISYWDTDFNPVHQVTLSPYFIDRYPATNAQYKECFDAGACPDQQQLSGYPGVTFTDPRLAGFPFVTTADHAAAETYCMWRGKRLPTEAEWERAARGPDSFDYPWGNGPPDCTRIHCDRPALAAPFNHFYAVGDDGGDVSPEGVHGLLTGVPEYVKDFYVRNYYAASPSVDPQGPTSSLDGYGSRGNWHVFKATSPSDMYNGVAFHCRPGITISATAAFGAPVAISRATSRRITTSRGLNS